MSDIALFDTGTDNHNLLPVLTREGVLLKVSISLWRGHKKLKPEDIGLRPPDPALARSDDVERGWT
jgi:hypothetical protein